MRSVYGLIGKVLGHSYSHEMFTRKFQDENINAEYRNFEIPSIECFKDIIANIPNIKGLNVTIPYKTEIIPYLHRLTPEAEKIGAVNVVCVMKKPANGDEDTELVGANTDVIGFAQSLSSRLKPHHKNALILGTGGVSKAVAYALDGLKMNYQFVSRVRKRDAITYSDLTEEMMRDAVVVNCTPLGMFPAGDTFPDIPYQYLSARNLLFDCVYNPNGTPFLKKGGERGCDVVGGLEMLRLQAREAWKLWQSTEINSKKNPYFAVKS